MVIADRRLPCSTDEFALNISAHDHAKLRWIGSIWGHANDRPLSPLEPLEAAVSQQIIKRPEFSGCRTVILILPAVGEVFAMNTDALSTTQSSVEKLTNDYRDAIILSQDGSVRRFERIDMITPLGTSVLRRMISSMTTRTKKIEVTLSEPINMPLPELKALLIRCIMTGGYFLDPDADEPERHRVAVAIEAAKDTIEIFRAFPLPEPEDALDGL